MQSLYLNINIFDIKGLIIRRHNKNVGSHRKQIIEKKSSLDFGLDHIHILSLRKVKLDFSFLFLQGT